MLRVSYNMQIFLVEGVNRVERKTTLLIPIFICWIKSLPDEYFLHRYWDIQILRVGYRVEEKSLKHMSYWVEPSRNKTVS